MNEPVESRGVGQDPGSRARDQLGGTFLLLSVALACGAVAAARDPFGAFLRHATWWWVGWSLLMITPGLVFTLVPWAMRSVFGRPPRGAVEDAERAFWSTIAFAAVLAALDAAAISCVRALGWQGWAGMAIAYPLAPLVATPAAVRMFRGRPSGLAVLLPASIFLNALLVEWGGGFTPKLLVR